jgi:hypothetical protein
MLRREKSILEHATKREWPAVRDEWSGVNVDLKKAMIEIKSEPRSQLISLGGWLRGIEALSTLVSQHYSARNARLLYQPVLLDYFGRRLSKMGNKIKADPVVIEMERGVLRLQPLIGSEHGPSISEQDVQKIRNISTDLVKSIYTDTR